MVTRKEGYLRLYRTGARGRGTDYWDKVSKVGGAGAGMPLGFLVCDWAFRVIGAER